MAKLDPEELIDEVLASRRTFLPGPPCDEGKLRQNLQRPILVGGLSIEERLLLLSILPDRSDALELQAMDKGLSGSKVFQARVRMGARLTKPYVVKVGPLRKIDREARAINEIVAPTIMGIGAPVHRRGRDLGLVVQDLATLSEQSKLHSLRNRVRESDDGPRLVNRLFADRLGPWYMNSTEHREFSLGGLFQPYLKKAPEFGSKFPPPWDELLAWVEADTGCSWRSVEPAIAAARDRTAVLPVTTVHGDLHTQNVIVDDMNECWPIDFAWTTDGSNAMVDLAMLECSLKFLALPMRSELRALLSTEMSMCRFEAPALPGGIPYSYEAERVFETVVEVRRIALEVMEITPADYAAGLLLMTYSLASHPGLNTPYVLASLQMLAECQQ